VRLLMKRCWRVHGRELQHMLRRAAIMRDDGNIDRDVISMTGLDSAPTAKSPMLAPAMPRMESIGADLHGGGTNVGTLHGSAFNQAVFNSSAFNNSNSSEMGERERVIAALEQAGWVQARAARLLGMTPRQIAYRIQTLNILMKTI